LETANLRVFGFEIDCVNLRVETYATDSRIPNMQFGSAYEDAMRRDFTINSLFYNLNTQQVEDFTNMGLDDLNNKIIRTPLPPSLTFQDDPLRILRAIRFSARYNFTLHPDIIASALDPNILKNLQTKISRERILKECEGV
jgi:tRNA nucleotidyltransferase (CCA-adding enzyme)